MASDEDLTRILDLMTIRLGRLPTEDEVIDFIMGDIKTKEGIWNGKPVSSD